MCRSPEVGQERDWCGWKLSQLVEKPIPDEFRTGGRM